MPTSSAPSQPPALIGTAKLLKMAFDGCDLSSYRTATITRLQAEPSDTAAMMDLCAIEQFRGDQTAGVKCQSEALARQRIYRSSWPTSARPLRVLALMAPGNIGINTPLEFLLQGSDIVLYSLYVVPGLPIPQTLPEHDIAIVTVGESDQNLPVMQEINRLIPTWPCPVLNQPDHILRLSRQELFQVVRDTHGLVMPPTKRIERSTFEKLGCEELELNQALEDLSFPIIARPIGSHAGRGLEKLNSPENITAYLTSQPEDQFYISPYIDYRSEDGLFRKYRIVWVDGRPYPCHMAIADEWKVWYLNAEMAASPIKRAEEAQFMLDFDEGFARRHATALSEMAKRLKLEYVGIDCAETLDGKLLVFEGDISLIVHDMDPPDIYPYKARQMPKLFSAFCEMLRRKSMTTSLLTQA